MNIWC